MGYDLELIQVNPLPASSFPVDAAVAGPLRKKAVKLESERVKELLLKIEGCRPGPGSSVDFLGKGLNYARFEVKGGALHVDNNCGPAELLRVHGELLGALPGLLILDLQSGQLHDAESYRKWWSRPL